MDFYAIGITNIFHGKSVLIVTVPILINKDVGLVNLYAEYIMRNANWMKHRLESRLPGEISITSDMQMTPPLWQKVKKN